MSGRRNRVVVLRSFMLASLKRPLNKRTWNVSKSGRPCRYVVATVTNQHPRPPAWRARDRHVWRKLRRISVAVCPRHPHPHWLGPEHSWLTREENTTRHPGDFSFASTLSSF